jgi:hypothetical protein
MHLHKRPFKTTRKFGRMHNGKQRRLCYDLDSAHCDAGYVDSVYVVCYAYNEQKNFAVGRVEEERPEFLAGADIQRLLTCHENNAYTTLKRHGGYAI